MNKYAHENAIILHRELFFFHGYFAIPASAIIAFNFQQH